MGTANAFGAVDVRDVADAHIAAAENPKASGRYMVTSPTGVSHITQHEYSSPVLEMLEC